MLGGFYRLMVTQTRRLWEWEERYGIDDTVRTQIDTYHKSKSD